MPTTTRNIINRPFRLYKITAKPMPTIQKAFPLRLQRTVQQQFIPTALMQQAMGMNIRNSLAPCGTQTVVSSPFQASSSQRR